MDEAITILRIIVGAITIISLWGFYLRSIKYYKDKKARKERERLAEIERLEQIRIQKEKDTVNERFKDWYNKTMKFEWIDEEDDEEEEMDGNSNELYENYMTHNYRYYSPDPFWNVNKKYEQDRNYLRDIIKKNYTYEIF